MKRHWVKQVLVVLAVLAIGTVAGFRILALEPASGVAGEPPAQGDHGDKQEEAAERRTRIDAQTAERQSIETAAAGPARIRQTLVLQGSVEYDVERVRRAMARYPGMIVSLSARIGDRVEAGDVLARVESDDSLQTYAIRAPIDGVVIKQLANAGETTGDGILYVVADLNRVWVDLAVFRGDQSRVQVGQPVRVRSLDGALKTEAEVGYIAPVSSATSQTSTARIFLQNSSDVWRPGMAVTGEVIVHEETVPLAVRNSALQTFEDADVVFVRVDEDIYKAARLELGRSDGEHTEVLSGLAPGAEYVVENSYLIKADLTKGSAEHAH